MKKNLAILFWLVFSALGSYAGAIPDKPNPPRLVNDYAGLLTTQQERYLEHKLDDYADSTSTQIAVVTVKSLEGYDVAQFANELFEKWGIGTAGKDNGLLLLIAPNERKLHIETGYGMEAIIPDITAKHIIEQYLVPAFKRHEYFIGIDDATTVMMLAAAGQFQADKKIKGGNGFPSFFILMVVIFIIMGFVSRLTRIKSGHYGHKNLDWLTALMLMNTMGGNRGSYGNFSSGRGNFGGGGGFGGFGGGMSGGGGASGSW